MGTSKGQGKYIETPELMLQLFEEYVKETKSNPRIVNVFGGKDFNEKQNRLERPLTFEGFNVFCFHKYGMVKDYFNNQDGRYEDYITVCKYIKEIIRKDQIEGGMVGQYNSSITQRLNNLVEKTDNKNENTNLNYQIEVVKSNIPLSNNESGVDL